MKNGIRELRFALADSLRSESLPGYASTWVWAAARGSLFEHAFTYGSAGQPAE
jgi:hypothetical protein